MPDEPASDEYEFDVFISYSRWDRLFVERLEAALEAYVPPVELGLGTRPMKVFRDVSDMTGTDYLTAIERHLSGSRILLVVCSPHARRSSYVGDEIQRFAAARRAADIVPVLLAGIPNNEARPGHEDQRAFPDALAAALEMPLAVPYLGIDVGRQRPDEVPFLDAWYGLLANIYGVSRHAIEARDRQRRTVDRRVASRELTGAGLDALGRDPELAALLAAHAVWLTLEDDGSVLPEAEGLLHRAVFGAQRRRTAPAARLTGHQGAVWDVRFSPDGSMLATASEDQHWALWRRDGTLIGATAGHTPAGAVKAIRFTPDGTQVFTAHLGHQAKLWSVSTGEGRGRLTAAGPVLDVAVSPDGRVVATASLDGVAEVYELATGTLVQRLVHTHASDGETEPTPIVSVAFSPDGALLATAGSFGFVRVWEVATGALRLDLAAHDEAVMDVAFDATGVHLATASDDSTWRLWDVTSGAPRLQRPVSPPASREARAKQAPMCLAFNATGTRLATGHRDKSVHVWDIPSGVEALHLRGHTGGVWGVDFSPDGRQLATASYDRTVALWDLDLDARAYTTFGDHAGAVSALAFSPDGSRLFSGSWDTTCRAVEVATGREIFRIENQTGTVHGLALSPDGRVLATANGNSTATLWDANAGQARRHLEGHDRDVLSVAFSADGHWLVTASDDGSAGLWDAETGVLVRRFAGAHDRVVAAAFALGDTRIVTAGTADPHDPPTSRNTTAIVWDIASGEPVGTLSGHELPLMALAVSPKGTMALTAGHDHTARLWDIHSATERAVLRGHASRLTCAAFTPDGAGMATGSLDETVRLWRSSSIATPVTLELWTGEIWSVAFSPDGSHLAIGGKDRPIVVCPLAPDALIGHVQRHARHRVMSVDECRMYFRRDVAPLLGADRDD
jgi:WD40 repeat protein